ncbi:hypothetical protein ACS0TY_011854 [Phlomoides rotata]
MAVLLLYTLYDYNAYGIKKKCSVNIVFEGNIRENDFNRIHSITDRIPAQIQNMADLVQSSKYINVYEKVAMFLSILVHHSKNRCVKFQFKRLGQIVSKQFHSVLRSGCLGALDRTYINVHVPSIDKGCYRNHKGQCFVNVLDVCDINMSFIYVLTSWEGSTADSRVLRDTIHREHGLKVPKGNYYLCDNGYPNCEGFLTPYKGVRYHLSEWNNRRPQNFQEYFDMKHTRAKI